MFENFYLEIEILNPEIKPPTRGTRESAGLDFYSPERVIIEAGKDILIPLGIKVRFPQGYALIFKEKSGIATKKKLDVGAAVVDSDYRGIVHAHLINNSDIDVVFEKNDKLIQAVIVPVWLGSPTIVSTIDEKTERGAGGFGSTGG